MAKKATIDQNPKEGSCPSTSDQGNKKLISKSNIKKRIATK